VTVARVAAGLFALLLLAGPARAWNAGGHMTIGAVAYEVLKADDPGVLARAVAVLKAHPQFAKLWKKGYDERPADERDLYLFMMAGRWADDIRKTPEDRPIWHYTNYGNKPAGQPATIVAGTPDPVGNIVLAYELNMAKLKAGPEDVDRAIPLCWVAHLVGDVHIPLHVTSLYTEAYPDGDRGGNRFFVKVGPGGRGINLHYFWDGLVTGEQQFRQVRNVATELRLRPEFARDKLTELAEPAFENWAKVESLNLAKTVVHRNGALKGGTGEFSAVELPADYPKAVKPVAERQAVLAGYRFAQALRTALK
jgi:hypothetical protein